MDRRHFLGVTGHRRAGAGGVFHASGVTGAPEKNGFTAYRRERRRNRFLNVALTTHEGRQVRFYDDLIKGKTVLLNIFYTVCTAEAICPLGTANLVAVQEILGPRVGRDVFMYSITLDPANDTPQVLKSYAKAFGVKPGWTFLTGERRRSNACGATWATSTSTRCGQGPVPAQRDAPLRDRAAGAVGRMPDPEPAEVDRQVPRMDGAHGRDGRTRRPEDILEVVVLPLRDRPGRSPRPP